MSDDVKTYSECDSINCPCCGVLFTELWEIYYDEGEEDFEVECSTCQNRIIISRYIRVSYTARKAK